MALIKCSKCGREISDKAEACLGCGAPVAVTVRQQTPTAVHYNRDTDTFTGTMTLMVKLAMRAAQELGWKLDNANETLGLVTFQTGMLGIVERHLMFIEHSRRWREQVSRDGDRQAKC